MYVCNASGAPETHSCVNRGFHHDMTGLRWRFSPTSHLILATSVHALLVPLSLPPPRTVSHSLAAARAVSVRAIGEHEELLIDYGNRDWDAVDLATLLTVHPDPTHPPPLFSSLARSRPPGTDMFPTT